MTTILFENERLKLLENEQNYVLVAEDMRLVYDDECKVRWVCVGK